MKKVNGRNCIAIISVLFFFSCTTPNNSQWLKQGGGESYDGGRNMVLDASGNVILSGRFQGTAIFDGKPLNGLGDDGIFLLKYSPDGEIIWAKEFGGKNEEAAYSMVIDSQNNLYITGYFNDTTYFDSNTLVSSGERDAFLAKCDTDGKVLWVKQFGSNLSDVGQGVSIDTAGNVIVTGFFTGKMFFDTLALTSNGFHEDIFIAKYDANGNFIWAKRTGGRNKDKPIGISACNNGNFYLSGSYSGTANFDSTALVSIGESDVFVSLYDCNGNLLWAKSFGGTSIDEARAMHTDNQNNVYLTGFFMHKIDFESSKGITSAGNRDVFVVKYNENGDLNWAQRGGGSGFDEGSAVSTNSAGECFITGFFGENAEFGTLQINPVGGNDAFIAHYLPDGELACLTQAGSEGYDEGRAVISNENSSFYFTGNYNGVFQLGDLKLPESKGDGDVFISKLTHTCVEEL